MTATYFRHGTGRSLNARAAEEEGRMPLTRAKQAVAREFGCTQLVAAGALDLLHTGEWHHVGKFAANCGYYNTADERLPGVVAHILACGGVKKFTERRARLRAERTGRWVRVSMPGRISAWAVKRTRARVIAAAALGRPVAEPFPTRLWEGLGDFVRGERAGTLTMAERARAAGWSDEQIALALAVASYNVEYIREHLTAM